MKTVRCAIYTRKSSEEGLEQDFNSLDAQREACAAYILSQASEGWKLVPDRYDDGGLSGGTLERPALQRLLDDIRQGRIDIIVVYKVDRLTRSLLDFAKLVDTFDAAGVSFVSITQSFNTTTSMGRLTLNMLLSFAQFEREVTAERIRDKIAASKAKGMWMGGVPPLGYRPDGRSLAIVEDHAALVREIYTRYLELGTVRLLADWLQAKGLRTPQRVTANGRSYGNRFFSRGQLYFLLRNPIYAGDIPHRDTTYPGNHPPIIARDIWEAVQAQLADHAQGKRQAREPRASLLAGLLFDPEGEPLIAVHTTKSMPEDGDHARKRYRYYVSKHHHHRLGARSASAMRLAAGKIERLICQELAALLTDPFALARRCECELAPPMLATLPERAAALRANFTQTSPSSLRSLVTRIVVHSRAIDLTLSVAGLAESLGLSCPPATLAASILHSVPVSLSRNGRVARLIDEGGKGAPGQPDQSVIRLLLKARAWWCELAQGTCDIRTLAAREGINDSYMTRIVRLAFLAPDLTEAILAGTAGPQIHAKALIATGAIPSCWTAQREKYRTAELGRARP